MSVALVIESINGQESDGYIPVSTQQTFVKYWIPICEKNNLKLLAYSKTGNSYNETHLPELIKEVEFFCGALNEEKNIPEDILEYLRDRSSLLLQELKRLEGNTVEFFLG
jgi:hypothetical protein